MRSGWRATAGTLFVHVCACMISHKTSVVYPPFPPHPHRPSDDRGDSDESLSQLFLIDTIHGPLVHCGIYVHVSTVLGVVMGTGMLCVHVSPPPLDHDSECTHVHVYYYVIMYNTMYRIVRRQF